MELLLIAKLVFKHFPGNQDLVEKITGWDKAAIDDGKLPKISNVFERGAFNVTHGPPAVQAVYTCLSGLSEESLALKWEAMSNEKLAKGFAVEFHEKDYLFWARKTQWTRLDAVLLSVGIVPTPAINKSIEGLKLLETDKCCLLNEIRERLVLLQNEEATSWFRKFQDPLNLIQWLERREFVYPIEFAEKVKKFQSPASIHNFQTPQKTLSDIERKTLLKLIAAMSAEQYNFDPSSKRNTATASIKDDLQAVGLSLDDKTILHWLREASELVHKDYWEKDA